MFRMTTHGIGEHLLRLERVDGEHRNVADQQESHDLAAGLAAVMLGQMHTTTRHVRNEQQLQDHLTNGQRSGHHHQQIRFRFERVQRSGNHAKHRVHEQAKGADAQQNVIQIALVLATELQRLHPDEADENGEHSESHQGTMRRIGQIDGEQRELIVAHQHEEQDQTDERADQQQESEEQALGGTDTIDATGLGLGHGDGTTGQHHF